MNDEYLVGVLCYLVQYWQTMSVVIEYTVERSVHSIVDIVHQSPVIGPFFFI